MEIDKDKTPAPGCIDVGWCASGCADCWRQYEERMKDEGKPETSTELQRR